MEHDEYDIKRDLIAIGISCAMAFFIGLLGGSFDLMVIISIPMYIGIRYLQTRGLL